MGSIILRTRQNIVILGEPDDYFLNQNYFLMWTGEEDEDDQSIISSITMSSVDEIQTQRERDHEIEKENQIISNELKKILFTTYIPEIQTSNTDLERHKKGLFKSLYEKPTFHTKKHHIHRPNKAYYARKRNK